MRAKRGHLVAADQREKTFAVYDATPAGKRCTSEKTVAARRNEIREYAAELGVRLDELVRHRIVDEQEAGFSLTYSFRHQSVQDTLLSELSLPARRERHTAIGNALEEFYGPKADAHADELAHHFGRSGPGASGSKAVR